MIRLIELFAGYGSQALALKYLGIPFEHHFVCEWDKYAMQAYNDIHSTNFETSDIKDIHADNLNITETDKYKYLLTYSFPCTDLSLAGKRQGMQRDSGTSSSLLWEVERILRECKELPQYLLMENVPQVVSKDNIDLFSEWTEFLTDLGYVNQYKLLNAKDFGVPQNRDRCFMVSILKSENKQFTFPKPRPLDKCLRDILEENVSESYYIRSERAQKLLQQLADKGDLHTGACDLSVKKTKFIDIANCVTAGDRGVTAVESCGTGVIDVVGHIEKGTGEHQSNEVYGVDGISPTLSSSYRVNVLNEYRRN